MKLTHILTKQPFVAVTLVLVLSALLSSCADGLNGTENTQVRTPQHVIANPGARTVEINWQGIAGASYKIYWQVDNGVDSKTEANIENSPQARFVHRELTNGATYYYRVSAITSEGESELSSQVQATPIPNPPNKPSGLINAYAGDGRVTIVWPQQAALGASRYALLWRDNSTQEERRIEDVVSPYVHQGLDNGVQYHYRLLGINDQGDGEPSDEMVAIPQQPLPAVPQNLTAQPSDGEIMLSWDDDGQAERFELYWSTSANVGLNAQRIASVSAPFHHVQLVSGQTYYYRLRAINSSGASALSSELMVTAEAGGGSSSTPLPGNPPPAPNFGGITLLPGDGQIAIRWQRVTNAQGYAIYWNTSANVSESDARLAHVTLMNSPGSTASADQSAQQLYVHTGLTNGQTYYYRIAALNEAGQSLSSPEVFGRPEKIVPGRPANVEIAAGDQWIAVRWNPVQNAASYNLYWRSAIPGSDNRSGTQISNVQSPFTLDTGYTLDSNGGTSGESLQNGIEYEIRVEAVSESGNQSCTDDVEPCTDWFSATPQVPPPAPPDGVRLIP
ncbi:fibronectin type III domain-containing protein, partial [Kaarinaea lacus]